ncbi:MAG: LytR/AlgR family response regulator transcription factor [Intestinibacter sp.]|uniref:LytR/AlgR family response regulator transcription factor n=1 Tax=Intestinibacter sp. TaxID=1965304 RepID=UPI003F18027D
MNINIKICEDNEVQLKYIEEKVKIILNDINCNIECFTSAGALLNSNLDKMDILILDLDLGTEWGIEVAKEIRARKIKCEIIFLTALENYSREGYKVKAFRYILKDDNMYAELEESLKECIKELYNKNKKIKIDTKQGEYYLDIDDILYLEVFSKELNIHTNDNLYKIISPINLFEKKLEPYYFFRCHKSYIINLKKVTRIEKNTAFIGDVLIPVSRYKFKEFKTLLAKALGDIL